MKTVWSSEVAKFIEQHWQSHGHRRMFFIGQVNVKVAALFQLSPDTESPREAGIVAALWLQGLESGNADAYAECDLQAMRVYESWRRSRELH